MGRLSTYCRLLLLFLALFTDDRVSASESISSSNGRDDGEQVRRASLLLHLPCMCTRAYVKVIALSVRRTAGLRRVPGAPAQPGCVVFGACR